MPAIRAGPMGAGVWLLADSMRESTNTVIYSGGVWGPRVSRVIGDRVEPPMMCLFAHPSTELSVLNRYLIVLLASP